MGNKLYVGNLSYGVSNADLEQAFSAHGAVRSAMVVMDRETGRSKGFGFVEMGTDQEAQTAISALHGKEMAGRTLTVNEARPKEEGARREGGRGGFGGGRRDGGGGGGFGGGRREGGGGFGGGRDRDGYGGGRGDRY
ncbi:MAG TPA: RNA-binding protein [Agitococcus sp.]|nr:RNA-binding protein [Agitococcus sp.]